MATQLWVIKPPDNKKTYKKARWKKAEARELRRLKNTITKAVSKWIGRKL